MAGQDDDLGPELVASTAGLLPLVGASAPLIKRLARAVRDEHRRRQSVALNLAEEYAGGLSREELTEQIAAHPHLQPLLVRLLHAAGMNGHDRTLRALGGALGTAVADRTRIDECELILTALADLTETHVVVLQQIDDGASNEWTTALVADVLRLSEKVTGLAVATLLSRGLIEQRAIPHPPNVTPKYDYGGRPPLPPQPQRTVLALYITDTGRAVLELLAALAS